MAFSTGSLKIEREARPKISFVVAAGLLMDFTHQDAYEKCWQQYLQVFSKGDNMLIETNFN